MRADQLRVLERRGIIVPEFAEYMAEDWRDNPQLALDAQPTMITAQNVGIPAYMANLLDPKTIRVLTTPMKAAMVAPEQKKGDWVTLTAQFPMVEATGEVASYNDYSNNGSTGSNYQWEPRQSYHYQTITQYGDRETEMFGLAQINYVSDLNFSSALTMSKFQNQMYLFGIGSLQNYGLLNDPALLAPITPVTKVAGGTTWAVALASEIFQDVQLLYTKLQSQMPAMIDRDTPLTMALSPIVEPYMSAVTAYTMASVRKAIYENWPNLKIVTVPEYNTAAGELIQLYVDEYDGQRTAYTAFTEKLRAGRIVSDLSSYKQKKIGGGWGAIIPRPVAIAQMLGV
jgi:hypothetical protein